MASILKIVRRCSFDGTEPLMLEPVLELTGVYDSDRLGHTLNRHNLR